MMAVSWLGRHRERVIALGGTLVVLLVRLFFGRHMNFCGTPDSCSYLALAESLSHHHGFAENFLYDFQMDKLQLPSHGIEYWLPGTSFLLWLSKPFGGVTLGSSIVAATLAGIVLSAAAWRIVRDYGGSRRIACASYLLCLVLPPMWFGSLTPDSTLFYSAAVAWFLVLFRVRFRSYVEDALALLCVLLASLIRNDAVLLLFPLLVVLWLRSRLGAGRGWSPWYCAVVLVGFVAVMVPMHVIDFFVLGRAFPSGASRVLFLSDLQSMSSYGTPATLQSYLALGAGRLIRMRAEALPLIVYRVVFLLIGFGIIFLLLYGLPKGKDRTRDAAGPEIAGGVTFAITLLLVYGLVLPAIEMSALRSFCGLLPLCAVLMVSGIREMVPLRKAARWLTAATMLFYFVDGTMEDRRTVPQMNQLGDRYRALAASLLAHGANPAVGSRVMTEDPAQFSETTSYAAIPLPENGLMAVRRAAEDFRVTHVLIDPDDLPTMEEGRPGTMAEVRSKLAPAEEWEVPGTHAVIMRLEPASGAR